MSDVIRNLTKLAGLSVLFLLALAMSFLMALVNYQSLALLFDGLGFENKKIGEDSLIGTFFEAIAPESTFSQWLALAASAAIFIGCILCSHSLFKMVRLVMDIAEYRRRKQPELVRQAITTLVLEAVLFLGVGSMLAVALYADMKGLSYRGLAGLSPARNDADIAATLVLPEQITGKAKDLFATELVTKTLPWLYLAVSVLAPVLLEVICMKIGDTFARMNAAIAAMMPAEQPPAFDDAANSREIAADTTRLDAAPDPAHAPPFSSTNAITPAYEPAPDTEESLVDVIGSNKRVSFAAALKNPREFHVDKKTKQVFDLQYWKQLQAND